MEHKNRRRSAPGLCRDDNFHENPHILLTTLKPREYDIPVDEMV